MTTPWSAKASWKIDAGLLVAAWCAVRAPLALAAMPPMIQFDTFSYMSGGLHNPPIYGWLLRLLDPLPAVIAQHLLALGSAAMVYGVARGAANRFAGVAAGLLVAIYGGFAVWGHVLMSETLFNFFLAAHLGALWLAIRRKSPFWYFCAGAAAGLAANVRPIIQLQPLVIAVALTPFYAARRELRRLAVLVAALAGGFLAICVPALIRGYLIAGHFVPLSTGLSHTLVERMIFDEAAPIGDVPADNAVLAAVRDFIAAGRRKPGFGCGDVFPYLDSLLSSSGDRVEALADSYAVALWKLYVARYPLHYVQDSWSGLAATLRAGNQETLTGNYLLSQAVLASVFFRWNFGNSGGHPTPSGTLSRSQDSDVVYVEKIMALPNPSVDALYWLAVFYLATTLIFAAGPLSIMFVLTVDAIVLLRAHRRRNLGGRPAPSPARSPARSGMSQNSLSGAGAITPQRDPADSAANLFAPTSSVRAYWLVVYLTAALVFLPNFLVSLPMTRYRFPFDLIFFLALGRAIATLRAAVWDGWRRMFGRQTADGSNPTTDGREPG
jgi:hypothetical protein